MHLPLIWLWCGPYPCTNIKMEIFWWHDTFLWCIIAGWDRASTCFALESWKTTLILRTLAFVEFSVSCAISSCASSVPAYSSLGISGKLILGRKAIEKCSLLSLPHHYCFYYYFYLTTIISLAQELKKFAFVLFPREMSKPVFTQSPCFPMPLPKCWNSAETPIQRQDRDGSRWDRGASLLQLSLHKAVNACTGCLNENKSKEK